MCPLFPTFSFEYASAPWRYKWPLEKKGKGRKVGKQKGGKGGKKWLSEKSEREIIILKFILMKIIVS